MTPFRRRRDRSSPTHAADTGPEADSGTVWSGQVANVEYSMLSGSLAIEEAEFENCVFDNLHAHGGFVRRTTVRDCASWSCSLREVELDEVVVENLKARVGGPGKSMPMFLWGCLARRTVLAGRIGSLIWNPPWSTDGSVRPSAFERARRFYDAVDWALDIRAARFTSVPSFRFGPPGTLIRRDPETQPLVTRRSALAALEATGRDSGVWSVVLDDLLRHEWPNEVVLIPAMGAKKPARERDLAGLALLESVGAFDDDPLRQV